MARNPQKIPCSHTGPGGRGCRAWAVRGSEPPLCATHARGRAGSRGEGGRSQAAQPGSENATTRGFYSTVLRPDELADLVTYAGDLSLDHEIACARVALRRVLTLLNAPMPASGSVVVEAAPAEDADSTSASPGDVRLSDDDRCLSQDDRCLSHDDRCLSHPDRCLSHPDRCLSHDDRCLSHDDRCLSHDDRCLSHPDRCLSHPDRCLSHPDSWLSPSDYARLAGLALQAIRTVAKLMRDRRALSGEAADGIAGAIAQALDELSTEWGISL